jgi:hypothetical protein
MQFYCANIYYIPLGKQEDTMASTLIMGAVIGLVCGIVFSALYFGPGQLTTPMAYIHDISGTLLFVLLTWILGLQNIASAGQE